MCQNSVSARSPRKKKPCFYPTKVRREGGNRKVRISYDPTALLAIMRVNQVSSNISNISLSCKPRSSQAMREHYRKWRGHHKIVTELPLKPKPNLYYHNMVHKTAFGGSAFRIFSALPANLTVWGWCLCWYLLTDKRNSLCLKICKCPPL